MPEPYDTFDAHYPQNPWKAVETKERTPWYYPQLYQEFSRRSTWNRFVHQEFNHNGPRATELVVTSITMPHVNHDPVGLRQQWFDASYMDSFSRNIKFQRGAGKLSLNKYDDMVTFWETDNKRGLLPIIRRGLGYMQTRELDKLARDAFLRSPFAYYGPEGNRSDFSQIAATDTATLSMLEDLRLGLKYRDVPVARDERGSLGGMIVCVTSPGVVFDIRNEADSNGLGNTFMEINRYSNPHAIMAGEVGTMKGVRFVVDPDAVLWNCGNIIARANVTAPIHEGDGAPDPQTTAVDSVEFVGQPNATHHVTVNSTTDIEINDRVSIHKRVTSIRGITDGADYTDGSFTTRRVVAKTETTLTFDRPILEDFINEIETGVYAYITKGTNIHVASFMMAKDGVARGIAQPPNAMAPPRVDDGLMIQRYTYDYYMGYQPFNKNAFEVAFLAGSVREVGGRYIR